MNSPSIPIRIETGFKLMAESFTYWANGQTDQFFSTINWWWEDLHINIPREQEAARFEAEMSLLFNKDIGLTIPENSYYISTASNIVPDRTFVLMPYWKFPTESPPAWRRALVYILLGAVWMDRGEKSKSIDIEYKRRGIK